MLRIRRYRIFLGFALFTIIALYHFSSLPSWGDAQKISVEDLIRRPNKAPPQTPIVEEPIAEKSPTSDPDAADKEYRPSKPPAVVEGLEVAHEYTPKTSTTSSLHSSPSEKSTTGDAAPTKTAPKSESAPVANLTAPITPQQDEIVQQGQGRLEVPELGASIPEIHWTKLPEHFPLPTQSIIRLPTGKPKSLPKVQAARFPNESATEKSDRQAKLTAIKDAFKHAWAGYKKFAWLQDELQPTSGGIKNPFCGWAATLVDSLDTLWVMGLREEFEDAVAALSKIDFTTSLRNEIPVFETTIRYLGGLLGAYDISGGKDRILVDKAVELAEVLLGAFDTPNRMPQMYYSWKPTFASQPHRASSRTVLSELGSLSMEFTRLAQITKEDRYYDAVARITNELEAWQMNTKVPGLWPVTVDASGCNKEIQRVQAPVPEVHTGGMPPYVKNAMRDSPDNIRRQLDSDPDTGPSSNAHDEVSDASSPSSPTSSPYDVRAPVATSALTGAPISGDTDCTPQGLSSPLFSSREMFTLGALSDSTFEYLPKMHILLGGLSPQYANMYTRAMAVVKNSLYFRPMSPKGGDILLTGKLFVSEPTTRTPNILKSESSHLTCFVGGWVGLGAKTFERGNLEIEEARKLTEGCIWAYESTRTGIMPEMFDVVACEDMGHCEWNETAWRLALDPMAITRIPAPSPSLPLSQVKGIGDDVGLFDDLDDLDERDVPGEKQRRQFEETFDSTAGKLDAGGASAQPGSYEHVNSASASSSTSTSVQPVYTPPPPPTHDEYVNNRIHDERLPPGFTLISDRRYLLRPEAIESVFVMYRITADPAYRAAGWKMFMAIDRYTRTTHGHSAIDDVTSEYPGPNDTMESFWLAETLKYFYLLFSDEDLVSLDDFVLNTEAHPFRRPKPN